MKRICFRRKSIVRSVHAIAIGIFFAMVAAARGQTATVDANGNVTIAGSGSNYLYDGSIPTLAPGAALKITSGSTITNTTQPYVILLAKPAAITNAGTLSVNYAVGDFSTAAAIYTTGGAQATSITNSGSASAAITGGGTASGIYYNNSGSAALTVSNSGTVSGTGAVGYGVYGNTGGNLSLTNSSSGTINAGGGTSSAIYFNAGGTANLQNQGSINVNADVASGIQGTSAGNLTATSSGPIAVTSGNGNAFGLNLTSTGGSLSLTASGAIGAATTGPIYGLSNAIGIATNTGNAIDTVTSSATITASAAYFGNATGIRATSNAGAIVLTNAGSVSATSQGSANGLNAGSANGAITITNSGLITLTSQTDAVGIAASTAGAVTVNTSVAAIHSTSSYGNAIGIQAASLGTNVVIANTTAPITASAYYTSAGIQATAGGAITITNGGTISATSTGTGGEGGTASPSFGITATTTGGAGNIAITNTGAVSASSSYRATGVTSASALYADASAGTGNALITNSGALAATSTGNGTMNTAGAIATADAGSATILNSGNKTITVNGTHSAYGLYAHNTGGGGGSSFVTNTGTGAITVSGDYSAGGVIAISSSGSATTSNTAAVTTSGGFSTGVSASGYINATVTNSGVIHTTSGSTSGYSVGLEADNSSTGTIAVTNTGAITATNSAGYGRGISVSGYYGTAVTISNIAAITASGSSYTSAAIFALGDGGTIDITNSGTLHSTSGYTGSGIYADIRFDAGDITIHNTGAITSTNSGSYAYGIYAKTLGSVSITNGGTLNVNCSNTSSGYATGIYASADGTINVANSAAVTVTDSSEYQVTGIYSNGTGAVTINNTGAISTTSINGTAIGIEAKSSALSTVTNSASVTVIAPGNSVGISSGSNSSLITNSGHVTVNSDAEAFGIDAGGTGAQTVSNLAAGTITINSTNNEGIGILASSDNGVATVTNAAAITLNDQLSTTGIIANGTSATLTNTGAVSTSNSNGGSIAIEGSSSSGTLSVTNSGLLTATSQNTAATGIQATGAGDTSILNTGAHILTVTATNLGGTALGILGASNAGALTVNNQQGISVSDYNVGYGINAGGSTASTTTNSGAITIASNQVAFGILDVGFAGDATINNTGRMTVNAGSDAFGLLGTTDTSGNVSITNSAAVTTTSSGGYSRAILADTSNNTGNIIITNTASGVASATSGGQGFAAGIQTLGGGSVEIDNFGTAKGIATGADGYGIYADPVGPIVVNNHGQAIGSTNGIYLASAGTVNNFGLASGGTNSIFVQSGSTVNLNGASPVAGLIKGGTDDTSSSVLNFNLAVRGNVAAVKASLDAAIAQYAQDLANALQGPGNDVDSEVVTINGIAYKWEDFSSITDALVQGRLYRNTAGYAGIGASIDGFSPGSTRGTAITNALGNLPSFAVADALAELSPQSLQVLRNIAFDNTSFTSANINNHLANLRDGLTGFDTSGFTINTPGVDPTLTQMRSHLLAWQPGGYDHGLLSDSISPLISGVEMGDVKEVADTRNVDRWSAFISGSVILANLDNNTSGIGDADYTTGSILAGADYRIGEHTTVGALFNYAHTAATLDGHGSKATVDTYAPGIYASYVDKGWYGNGMLMYGFNSDSDDRNITIPGISGTNHGRSDGGQVTANFTGGYEFQRGDFKYGPVLSLQYVHLNVGAFQEDGPTALSINSQDADSLRTLLGFQVRYSAQVASPYGPIALTPHFQASWQHEYMDNSDGITSQFDGTGGGPFTVQGRAPERDSAFLDLGLDAQLANNVTFFIDYQAQAGQSDFFAQSAQGGVRVGF